MLPSVEAGKDMSKTLILDKDQEKGLMITESESQENAAIKTKYRQKHVPLASKKKRSEAAYKSPGANLAITYKDNLGTSTAPQEDSLKKAVVVVKRITTKESTIAKKDDKDYSLMKRQFELLQQQLDQLKQKLADKEEGDNEHLSPNEEVGTIDDGINDDGEYEPHDGQEKNATYDGDEYPGYLEYSSNDPCVNNNAEGAPFETEHFNALEEEDWEGGSYQQNQNCDAQFGWNSAQMVEGRDAEYLSNSYRFDEEEYLDYELAQESTEAPEGSKPTMTRKTKMSATPSMTRVTSTTCKIPTITHACPFCPSTPVPMSDLKRHLLERHGTARRSTHQEGSDFQLIHEDEDDEYENEEVEEDEAGQSYENPGYAKENEEDDVEAGESWENLEHTNDEEANDEEHDPSLLPEPGIESLQWKRKKMSERQASERQASKKLTCSICHIDFEREFNFMRHRKCHLTNSTFVCIQCPDKSDIYEKWHRLQKHMQECHWDDRFKCPECTKDFKCASKLEDHIAVHSGSRPYSCNICTMKFKFMNNLRVHKKSLHGQKVPTCSTCQMKFSKPSFLKRHMMVHNDDAALTRVIHDKTTALRRACPVCSSVMCNRKSMVRHFKDIHGLDRQDIETYTKGLYPKVKSYHLCEICNVNFSGSSALREHKKAHLSQNRFKYDFCPSAFTFKRNMKQHVHAYHREKASSLIENTKAPEKAKDTTVVKREVDDHFKGSHAEYPDQPENDEKPDIIESDQPKNASGSNMEEEGHMEQDIDALHLAALKVTMHKQEEEHSKNTQEVKEPISEVIEDNSSLGGSESDKEDTGLNSESCGNNAANESDDEEFDKAFRGIGEVNSDGDDMDSNLELGKVDDGSESDEDGGDMNPKSRKSDNARESDDADFNPKLHSLSTLGSNKQFSDDDERPIQMSHQANTSPKDSDASLAELEEKTNFTEKPTDQGSYEMDEDENLDECWNVKTSLFHCSICDSKFTTKEHLRRHKKSHKTPSTFTCYICPDKSKVYYTWKQLAKHYFTSHPSKSYPCTICSKTFSSRYKLKQHMPVHSNEKHYECSICSAKFKYRSGLISHKIKTHNTDAPRCTICDAVFGKMAQLERHMIKHDPSKLTCEICSKSFVNEGALGLHRKRMHGDENTRFDCFICNKSFAKLEILFSHEICHKSKRPYKCELCPQKSFKNWSQFKDHKRRHSKRFPCPKCPKIYRSISDLAHHNYSAHVRTYDCKVCSKTFDDKDALNEHKARHLEEKNFLCSQCPRSFAEQGDLNRHVRNVHTKPEELSLTCHLCTSKVFKTQHSLKAHIKRHSDEKPHQCNVCGKCFRKKDELEHHGVMHRTDTPFPCKYCGKGFKGIKRRKQHERESHGTIISTCEICGFETNSTQKLRMHKKKFHEKKSEGAKQRVYAPNPPVTVYACSKCSDTFNTRSEIMEHAKIHSDDDVKGVQSQTNTMDYVERTTVYAGAYDNLNQNTMDRLAPSTINVKQSASPPIMGFLFTCGKCKQRFNTKEEVVEHTKLEHGAST